MIQNNPRLAWLKDPNIRPYVFVRSENRIKDPGSLHKLKWFSDKEPVYINPMEMEQVGFGNQILQIESQAFGPSGMEMPRWVFFDCAVTPGFVAGFAIKTKALDPEVRKALKLKDTHIIMYLHGECEQRQKENRNGAQHKPNEGVGQGEKRA